MTKESDKTTIIFRISRELKEKLHVQCIKNAISMNDFFIDSVNRALQENNFAKIKNAKTRRIKKN